MRKEQKRCKNTEKNNRKIKSKRILPIIIRRGRKYYYTHHITTKTRITQLKSHIRQLKSIKQSSLFVNKKDNQIMLSQFNPQVPILFTNVTQPTFKMPQYLQVTMHEGRKIDYTDNNLFYKVATSQILQLMNKQNKNTKNAPQFNISIPQMQLTQKQYTIPKLVQFYNKKMHKVNIWIYFGERFTDWHYDGHDNFLYVLEGQKVVYLAQPNKIKSRNVFSLFNNHCDQNFLISKNKNNIYRAIINKGKCLFIPKGWWHKVYSDGYPNIALNFWTNSLLEIVNSLSNVDKNLIMKHLLFQKSEQYCKKVIQKWEQMNQNQKQQMRIAAGYKILQNQSQFIQI